MLAATEKSQLITGLTITQPGCPLPPLFCQLRAFRLTQSQLIPVTNLQSGSSADFVISSQRTTLACRLLHPMHGVRIVGLCRHPFGELILRLTITLFRLLSKLYITHRRACSGTTGEQSDSQHAP